MNDAAQGGAAVQKRKATFASEVVEANHPGLALAMSGSSVASMVEIGLVTAIGIIDGMVKTDRALWLTTLRCGAVSATVGLLVAVLLYFLNPLIGFPSWCWLIWPAAFMLMALSGMSEESAQLWWLAIVASNALFYFLVSVFLAPLIILVRRALVRFRGKRPMVS